MSFYSKVAVCKISIQKSVFLYTHNEQPKMKLIKQFHLKQHKKYLGIHSVLYTENYKTLLKKVKDLNTEKDIPCSWIRRLKIIKLEIFPKLIYRFNAILSQKSEFNKMILKFLWKCKGPRIVKAILKKKNEVGGLILITKL